MKNFLVILFTIVAIALLDTFIGGLAGQILASLLIAILLFTGKGDILIAGYNTASKEEKEKCNIKRLRFLAGSLFVLVAGLMAMRDIMGKGVFTIVTLLLCVVVIVLANTWAKK